MRVNNLLKLHSVKPLLGYSNLSSLSRQDAESQVGDRQTDQNWQNSRKQNKN